MIDFPKVTIIMATYNRAHFIVETLKSIQNQTFSNWECLIVDDGGTDNTTEIIRPILVQDSRFRLLKRIGKYKKGLPGCRNYGLDLAKGEFIIFFDDDDVVHPQNLELCVLELSRNDVSFCRYLRSVFFNEFDYNFEYATDYNSFFIDVNDVEKLLKNELPFNSCAVMWSKECFTNNRFVENLMYAEEWELYSRILTTKIKGISINKCLFYGRKHPNSNTGEFFNHNPIRRASNSEAIFLVVQNLKQKQLLSPTLLKYFITESIDYKEYKLFDKLLNSLELSKFEKLYWWVYYQTYPIRILLYRMKKVLIK